MNATLMWDRQICKVDGQSADSHKQHIQDSTHYCSHTTDLAHLHVTVNALPEVANDVSEINAALERCISERMPSAWLIYTLA